MILGRLLDMRGHAVAWREVVALFSARRELLLVMAWRDLTDRYAGQMLGAAWAVLSPLLMMGTYLVAFGLIFRGRLGIDDDGSAYIAYMLAGLAPWMATQDCLARAATAISGQANLVKQIVFPSEILPLRIVFSSLPTLLIGLVVTIPLAIYSGAWRIEGLFLLLPLALCFFAILLAGFSLWLAAIGVFARDIKDLITFLLGIGLFLHPILYPPGSIPVWLEPWFVLSPFSHMIWCFRDALTPTGPLHIWSWIIFPALSLIVFTTGWRGYRMLKPSFGNIL